MLISNPRQFDICRGYSSYHGQCGIDCLCYRCHEGRPIREVGCGAEGEKSNVDAASPEWTENYQAFGGWGNSILFALCYEYWAAMWRWQCITLGLPCWVSVRSHFLYIMYQVHDYNSKSYRWTNILLGGQSSNCKCQNSSQWPHHYPNPNYIKIHKREWDGISLMAKTDNNRCQTRNESDCCSRATRIPPSCELRSSSLNPKNAESA